MGKTRIITDCNAKTSVLDICMERLGPEKQKSTTNEDMLYVKKAKQFSDVVNQMITLDPEKRATPDELLKHHFLVAGGFGKPAEGENKGEVNISGTSTKDAKAAPAPAASTTKTSTKDAKPAKDVAPAQAAATTKKKET